VATLAMTVLGLLWLPVVPKLSSQLYIYLQSVQGYVAAPITCVFLVGVLWRGANSTGAMACLTIGTSLGLLRLVAEITLGRHYVIDVPVVRLVYALFVGSNFLHFTGGLFLTCVGIIVAASHLAPLPPHGLSEPDLPVLPSLRSLLRVGEEGEESSSDDGHHRPMLSARGRLMVCGLMSVVVVFVIVTILFIFR
jgi:hypothetical protein